jgi:hypothetical protein
LREVIIALYSGLRMRHIVGGNGWSPSVAHNLWRPCDEGGEPSILCPCNEGEDEGEGDNEELSSTQLLQKLKLRIPQKVNQRTGKQSANNSKSENQSTNDEHNE